MFTTIYPGKVPEAVVRTTAIEVCVIAVFTIVFASPWLAILLVLDFGARGFLNPKLSPLAMITRNVWVPLFRLKGPQIFYTPKKFAARIGFILALAASVLLLVNKIAAGSTILGILALFSFMEGAFGYCVGCKIYGFLVGRGILDGSDCRDCVK